ncbi:MAG: hypothetical protein IV090_11800 [Candidatus Sericytochromatia bacterium]|nr:hypothetical protein [Candidatus Sericytochromatia bacterium]
MLIQSQNAFFENLQRSAQNTSPSKPAGSDSSLPDTSSQRVGFAHSPKTSLNQAENSLGKGGLKALFSSGSVYQGLSTLAEARNTGPTTVQPVSATEALAEGGEIPPIPDLNNIQACTAFIEKHTITASEVLAYLESDQETILALKEITFSQQNSNSEFKRGYDNLSGILYEKAKDTYQKKANNQYISPDPQRAKEVQILHSIIQNVSAICSPDFNPHKKTGSGWIKAPDLNNLKEALRAVESGKGSKSEKKMVSYLLNEVQNHPFIFLKETVKNEKLEYSYLQETNDIYYQNQKELFAYDHPVDKKEDLSSRIAKAIYRDKYEGGDVTSIFSTQMKPSSERVSATESEIRIGKDISIQVTLPPPAIQQLRQKNSLPSSETIAQAFDNIPETVLKNYAKRFQAIIWPQTTSTKDALNFLVTHKLTNGENCTANLEIGLVSTYPDKTSVQNLYEGILHEVGHVFYYTEFDEALQGKWDLAIMKDHLQPKAYRLEVKNQSVTRYAQINSSGAERVGEDKRCEDIGETFALYILSIQNSTPDNNLHAQFREVFPHRFAILDQFADKLLTPEQIQQYLPTPK